MMNTQLHCVQLNQNWVETPKSISKLDESTTKDIRFQETTLHIPNATIKASNLHRIEIEM